MKQVYTPADLEGLDYTTDIGMPGEFPFVRNVQALDTKDFGLCVSWFPTAEESNARYRYLIIGLSLRFPDTLLQIGFMTLLR